MHELSIAQEMMRLVFENAGEAKVVRIGIDIGDLTGFEPDALTFCLEALLDKTPAAGATLDVARIPGSGFCNTCARVVALARRYDACPECGGLDVDLRGGRELRLRELEVE